MSAMTQGSASRTAVPRTASSPAARTSSTAGRATSGTAGSPSARPAARQVPGLRLVPQRRSTAARAPFVATVVSLLVVGLLGLLVLNTVVNQQSFRLSTWPPVAARSNSTSRT